MDDGSAGPAGPDASPGGSGPPSTQAAPTPAPSGRERPERERPPLRGIDVSHHQGDIDWTAVAGDGVDFAYLKATEGTGFVDPAFAAHRAEAAEAGLRVGGYHYLSACTGGSPAADQAAHFADVLRRDAPPAGRSLPPALDVELGACADPLDRPTLLAEVTTFLDTVERALGREPVVYLYPDVEERYALAADLEQRQWVRRLGDEPPVRDWWMWQRSATATVAGVDGPVDLDLMRRRAAR